MRERSIAITLRTGAAMACLAAGLAAAVFLALADAASAQAHQPKLNPEDEFAPSQLVQPMPAAVSEPTFAAAPAAAAPAASPQQPAAHRPPAHAVAGKPEHDRRRPVRTVVECSGPFAKDSGMLALAVAYDARDMIFTHETVQGAEVGVTVMFPKDPRRRLEVWWQNPNRTGLYLIDIAGKSIWTAPKGLRLGLSLEQLERLNRKPFKLNGFNADGIASVEDWNGGALADLPGGCKAGVSLRANGHKSGQAGKDLPAKDEYSSDDPALRALRPTVSEILIGY
jgi:hypothetical protein